MTRAQRGKEITNQGQMLGNKAWGKPLRVQLASRTSQQANEHYGPQTKLHQGTHGSWEAADAENETPSLWGISGGQRPWPPSRGTQLKTLQSAQGAHVRVTQNTGSCPLPSGDLRKTPPRVVSPAQRKAETTSPAPGARRPEAWLRLYYESLPM